MMAFNPEHLRPIEFIGEPDPRWLGFSGLGSTGEVIGLTLERYAQPIQAISLHCDVPEDVVTHFETAKNLALYAWFVYRFIPVAELYSFISVEFALRKKLASTKLPFKVLLTKAIEEGWLKNGNFSQWRRVTDLRQRRYQEEMKWAEFLERPAPQDPEYWNYLGVLVETIPWFRNSFAHGTTSISPWAYTALEDCGEIINQLYAAKM